MTYFRYTGTFTRCITNLPHPLPGHPCTLTQLSISLATWLQFSLEDSSASHTQQLVCIVYCIQMKMYQFNAQNIRLMTFLQVDVNFIFRPTNVTSFQSQLHHSDNWFLMIMKLVDLQNKLRMQVQQIKTNGISYRKMFKWIIKLLSCTNQKGKCTGQINRSKKLLKHCIHINNNAWHSVQ